MKLKWNFPIARRIIKKYKELGFLKFLIWFLLIWLGIKILVVNVVGILFFDIEPFPIMNSILNLIN